MRKSVTMGLVASVLGMGMASAEIKVSDALSLSGFIDMSVVGSDVDGGSTLSGALDQFELDFMFKLDDKFSARVDLAQGGVGGGAGAMAVEQGYLTYASGPLAITTGKFLSATGFEAAEPTGLYQYSASRTVGAYGGYVSGASVAYTLSPMIGLYGALTTSEWTAGDQDFDKPGAEVQVSLTPMEGVTAKAAFLYESMPGDYSKTVINVWAMYAAGPLTAAAEVNVLSNYTAEDDNGLGYLVMGNYKLNDNLGITGRYSAIDTDLGGTDSEVTVSPGLALTSSIFTLAEVSYLIDQEVLTYAVEAIVSF
jgi:hypothetical protein